MVPISDATRVAEVRRVATNTAEAEGLTSQACEEVALIATEIATNLLKHATSGQVMITGLSVLGEPGVELISIDSGPGMISLPACLVDGFSTSGTSGTGLGAIRRLADVFDGFSQRERGTVLVARKFAQPQSARASWRLGAVMAPYPGESVCGDNCAARQLASATSVIVADGLGHGVLAADASTAAVNTFQRKESDSPATLLEHVHQSLRSTRGAAVAIVRINHETQMVHYAGVGNITGVLLGGPRPQFMISHNGTAGLELRRIQEFEYRAPDHPILVMHSDGLNTNWSLDSYPGLARKHPSVIAGILYRDSRRGRDDVCVVVGSREWL